jgi:steroid delta-isomerase-like uncharacterized protein
MSARDRFQKQMDAFNRHSGADWETFYAPDAVVYDPQYPEPLRGRAAIRKDVEDFFGAFPDIRVTLRTVLEDGDAQGWEVSVAGTHKGALPLPTGDVAPTGKRIELSVGGFARVNSQGLVVEERRYFDLAGMMAQLGLA